MLRFVSRRFWRGTTREQEKGTSLLGSDVPSSLLTPVALPCGRGQRVGHAHLKHISVAAPQEAFVEFHKHPLWPRARLAALPGAVSQQVPLGPRWVMTPCLPTQPRTPQRISVPVTGLQLHRQPQGWGLSNLSLPQGLCLSPRVGPRLLPLHAISVLFRVRFTPQELVLCY